MWLPSPASLMSAHISSQQTAPRSYALSLPHRSFGTIETTSSSSSTPCNSTAPTVPNMPSPHVSDTYSAIVPSLQRGLPPSNSASHPLSSIPPSHSQRPSIPVTSPQRRTPPKKVFRCPVPGCNQTSSNKGNLSKHIATKHEHRKDYECPFDDCSRRFAKKYNMLRHLSASGVHRQLHNRKNSPFSHLLLYQRKSKSKQQNIMLQQQQQQQQHGLRLPLNNSHIAKRKTSTNASRSRWSSMELDLAQFLAQQCKWRSSVKAG